MGKKAPDAYNLLFGNMGPELLNWVVKKPSFPVKDCVYFGKIDSDPACIFVSAKSKFKTIDDIVAEGKKRQLNVGTSRLAHPASIGVLALAEHTGAKFNLIPLSGGKNTIAGALTGEVDFSALPASSVVVSGEHDPGPADLRRQEPAAAQARQCADHERAFQDRPAADAVVARLRHQEGGDRQASGRLQDAAGDAQEDGRGSGTDRA